MTKKNDRDEFLIAGSKTSHASTAPGNQSGTPLYQLRCTPKTVPKDCIKNEFGLNDDDQPLLYIQNDYKNNGDGTVTDRTSGLMWQQSGSEEPMCCGEVASYLTGLNQLRFAGYSDWRLPTIPELMSLLESSKKNGMLYIDTVFGKQCWCWSSDSRDSNMAWGVDFLFGEVVWVTHNFDFWVRAVRSEISEYDTDKYSHSTNKNPFETEHIPMKKNPLDGGFNIDGLNQFRGSSDAPQNHLRSTPKTVPEDLSKKEFGLNDYWKPSQYVRNDYKDNGDGTVTDRSTGLMWQQSGSEEYMFYDKVAPYIDGLNQSNFAGYSDWRLPTIPELMSLLERTEKKRDLYIDAVFDSEQRNCWSSDVVDSGSAWNVLFYIGEVDRDGHDEDFGNYVRAVRSGQ